MRINKISSTYGANKYNNQIFNGLVKDKSAMPIIKNMSESDILEFKQIEKRLSETKFWDMKISSIGNKFQEFKFNFINKNYNNHIITDGIYPYNLDDNTIKFYSIVYGPENTSFNTIETLRFKSAKQAEELYNNYQQNILYLKNRGYNISPLESLKIKEIELKMLEESSKNTNGKRNIEQVDTKLKLTKKSIGNDFSTKDNLK